MSRIIRYLISMTLFLGLALQTIAQSLPDSIPLPNLTGEYAVGVAYYHLIDNERPETLTEIDDDMRELMISVFYPAQVDENSVNAPYVTEIEAENIQATMGIPSILLNLMHTHSYADVPVMDGQFPVLLFSHGSGVIPQFYRATFEEIASHGYIIVVIAHTYNAAVVTFLDGHVAVANLAGSITGTTLEEMDASANQLGAIWVSDAQFVLDELATLNENDDLLAGHLDLTMVGMFGHSFGGATAAEMTRVDERVLAGINMDGSLFGQVKELGITRPFMFLLSESQAVTDEMLMQMGITRQEFDSMMAEMHQTWEDSLANSAAGYLVILKESAHNTYITDQLVLAQSLGGMISPDEIGTINPSSALTIIHAYIVGFFNYHLKGEITDILSAPSPFSEVDITLFELEQ